MCRTTQAVLSVFICGTQMLVRVIMTLMLLLENLLRLLMQTLYNLVSFLLQLLSLLPICIVFIVSSRLKCFMCGGGGPCPVNRGGGCDCLMSLMAIIILFFIFRATGVLDKIFYSIGYAKAPTQVARFIPTPGEITECSRNDTEITEYELDYITTSTTTTEGITFTFTTSTTTTTPVGLREKKSTMVEGIGVGDSVEIESLDMSTIVVNYEEITKLFHKNYNDYTTINEYNLDSVSTQNIKVEVKSKPTTASNEVSDDIVQKLTEVDIKTDTIKATSTESDIADSTSKPVDTSAIVIMKTIEGSTNAGEDIARTGTGKGTETALQRISDLKDDFSTILYYFV